MSGSKLPTDHFYSAPVLDLSNKTCCEVPSAKCLTAKSTMKHFEACVCITRPPRGTVARLLLIAALVLRHTGGERTDYHFPEGGSSFHSSEQAKQTT